MTAQEAKAYLVSCLSNKTSRTGLVDELIEKTKEFGHEFLGIDKDRFESTSPLEYTKLTGTGNIRNTEYVSVFVAMCNAIKQMKED